MVCGNCGYKNQEGDIFCTSCGRKLELTTKKNNVLPKTILLLIVIIGGLIFTLFCAHKLVHNFMTVNQKVHSYKNMISVLDNLDCSKNNNNRDEYTVHGGYTTKDKNLSCNLKNKYEVLKKETIKDDNNNDVRKIYLKLKDYDVEFIMISSKECTATFVGPCITSKYVITTDYQEKASQYFYNEYNKNSHNNVCNNIEENNDCSLQTEKDIDDVVEYVFDYAKFLNNLDIRTKSSLSLSIYYPNSNNVYRRYERVYLILDEGKYVVKIHDDGSYKKVNEEELRQYLLNYIFESK